MAVTFGGTGPGWSCRACGKLNARENLFCRRWGCVGVRPWMPFSRQGGYEERLVGLMALLLIWLLVSLVIASRGGG